MTFDWQLLIVLGIVAIAVAYVARGAWKLLRGKAAGCGSGCGSCSGSKQKDSAPRLLVALGEKDEAATRP